MWNGEGYERRAKIFGIGFGRRTYSGSNPAAEPGRRISAAVAAKAEIFFDEPVSEGAIHGSGSGFKQGWNAADIWQQQTLTYTLPVR